ncbi:hypothetical protein EXIGLDRAFT_781116 [Exidia glandulosa HHB12029]|uniref:Clavaminate synthase-like protein n=1 Tax=Exidia glandulosa HHB12029 TaxID=1314781 RepID=A0A165BCY3_EXIGL|nr:hypothetical protein EXIGLDRAFT_781116 [Exidia glandulosa HHB12029]
MKMAEDYIRENPDVDCDISSFYSVALPPLPTPDSATANADADVETATSSTATSSTVSVMAAIARRILQLEVYEHTTPSHPTPQPSSSVTHDDYPRPPPPCHFVLAQAARNVSPSTLATPRDENSASEASDSEDDGARTGVKRKRTQSHLGRVSSGIRQFSFRWARGIVRARGRRGKRTHTADGWDLKPAKEVLTNVDVCPMDQFRHDDLATNGNPYIGPLPVSKPKFDKHMAFDWEETTQDEEFPTSVQELLQDRYCILRNNSSLAQVIVGKEGVIIAVKARPIKGVRWEFIVESVEEQLTLLNTRLTHHAAELEKGTQRTDGVFKSATIGVGMGMGQTEPKYWNVRNEWHEPIRDFIDHPDVRIFANHMSDMFKFWFPKLWNQYNELEKMLKEFSHDHIHGAFPGFPMMSITANTGKKVATPMHIDFKNAAYEINTLVQLAPGDVIFILSALITHGNTELGKEDTHRSWTMFNPGALLRFRDAGMKTMQDLRRSQGAQAVKDFQNMYPLFRKESLGVHMTLEQLRKYHAV